MYLKHGSAYGIFEAPYYTVTVVTIYSKHTVVQEVLVNNPNRQNICTTILARKVVWWLVFTPTYTLQKICSCFDYLVVT